MKQLLGAKGAARIALIPEVLQALNAGAIRTVNLVESSRLDLPVLVRHVARSVAGCGARGL